MLAAGGTLWSCLPHMAMPKRWLDIQPGQTRVAVHAVLGVPDAPYDVKNFDGWHNPFGLGASVLIVRYDEGMTRVESKAISTHWGNAHRVWMQAYRSYLTRDAAPK